MSRPVKWLSSFVGRRLAPEGVRLAAKRCFWVLNWRTQYTIRLPKLCRESLDLWYALPRHHSARPRPQLTGCFALQEHRPHTSRLIASAPFAP